jgi:hypothetical protein
MLRSVATYVSASVLAVTLCCAGDAGAQTQMQGKTVGSPPPVAGSPAPATKPTTPKAKRAACTSQGESQGLKGKDLKKFVKDCMNKPA